METVQIGVDNENNGEVVKRKNVDNAKEESAFKKQKSKSESEATEANAAQSEVHKAAAQTSPKSEQALPYAHAHQSPKKRLEVAVTKSKEKFIYGNYSQYYGYRNKGKDFHDIRLDVFETMQELFRDKQVVDIGCNNGYITMEMAKKFPIKHIFGIDIDRSLIKQAQKQLVRHKKALPVENEARHCQTFPFNVSFVRGNYVLMDDVLLEIESAQFDVILCLSVTKWIHLNFGDAGLKQAFRRMFLQLHSGGKLILEAQPFDNYGRRKKMTETIFANYQAMQFFPKDFTDYLLSAEVGFKSAELIGVPEHCAVGFKRPIQIFNKE